MITDAVDFRFLLLENYKKLGISETQLAVLLVIDHLLKQDNHLITADLLGLKMTLPLEKIDQTLVELLEKKWIEYDNAGSQMKTTLNPIKRRLYQEFQLNVIRGVEQKDPNQQTTIAKIISQFEKDLQRTLSPLEMARIGEWIGFGYTEALIKKALAEALQQGKKSLRAVDKILLKYTMKEDVEKEGVSAISAKWEKDIQKTLAIAQTKWVDDDQD